MKVRVGSIVRVAGSFGTGTPVLAEVVAVLADVKNGFPGIEYFIVQSGEVHWAYMDQILEVKTY